MSLLTCRNVSFAYDGNVVLDNLNFSIDAGDYLCIVGENGAGKSTLIKGLLQLQKPFSGEISTGDGFLRNKIGYVPQQTDVQKDFPASVFEVVLSGCLNSLGFMPFYSKKQKQTALDQMERLSISDLKNRCFRELSGGQQRRVLLARALCASKNLLILDEPAAGLDPVVTKELYELIHKINVQDGITIVMVSHDVRCTIDYATKILHLHHTQLFYGDAEDYFKSETGKRFIGC